MRKAFKELTLEELSQLRKEIILNSILIYDYTNSFGFNSWDICSFFDGYVSYLNELAREDGYEGIDYLTKYDTEENLYSWFLCYDDLSWVRFEEDEE